MAIKRDTRNFLDLVYRSKETVNGWKRVSNQLFVMAQNSAIDAGNLVEFAISKDRVGYIRLTEKGKKLIKPR